MKNKVIFGLTVVALLWFVFGLKALPGNGGQEQVGEVLGARTEADTVELNLPSLNPLVKPPKKLNDSQPPVNVGSAILMDGNSSYPLYAENELESVPIASVTKVMTALVVLDNYDLADEVTISANAASTIGSSINLRTDEVITVESLIKGLMIQSGNDAAVALAEKMGYEKFLEAMNAKALELGLADTVYKDPAGLDDTGLSTPKDLATLASYALRNELLKKIVTTEQETVYSTDGLISHDLKNSNRLIKKDHPLYMSEAYGLKTGFTPEAGHCLVSSAEKDGNYLISVILKTDEHSVEASAKESKKLLKWGFKNHEW